MAILNKKVSEILAEDLGTPCDYIKIETFMNDNCWEWCFENCSKNMIDNKWKCWEKYFKSRGN